MSHPSDLALERLLQGEAVPEVHPHLASCDVCWDRWLHLNQDEGLPVPVRPRPPVANLPAPVGAGGWAPWAVAAVALMVALGSLTGSGQNDVTEVLALEAEVASLKQDLEEAKRASRPAVGQRPPEALLREEATPRPTVWDKAMQGVDPPGAASLSKEELDAAVDDEIRRRTLDKMDRVREDIYIKTESHVDKVLLRLSDEGLVPEALVPRVQALILDEFEQIWDLKADAGAGDLTHEEAVQDYELLRSETDEALEDLLGAEVLSTLRANLDGK